MQGAFFMQAASLTWLPQWCVVQAAPARHLSPPASGRLQALYGAAASSWCQHWRRRCLMAIDHAGTLSDWATWGRRRGVKLSSHGQHLHPHTAGSPLWTWCLASMVLSRPGESDRGSDPLRVPTCLISRKTLLSLPNLNGFNWLTLNLNSYLLCKFPPKRPPGRILLFDYLGS
jgi:hypothetical protein